MPQIRKRFWSTRNAWVYIGTTWIKICRQLVAWMMSCDGIYLNFAGQLIAAINGNFWKRKLFDKPCLFQFHFHCYELHSISGNAKLKIDNSILGSHLPKGLQIDVWLAWRWPSFGDNDRSYAVNIVLITKSLQISACATLSDSATVYFLLVILQGVGQIIAYTGGWWSQKKGTYVLCLEMSQESFPKWRQRRSHACVNITSIWWCGWCPPKMELQMTIIRARPCTFRGWDWSQIRMAYCASRKEVLFSSSFKRR